ncbi:hypothetical protein LTR91_016978 [Friedmanniomyces endolithicus]|uniref:NYN domain-containing protein n=1 Tax=Friedmanniomyces endolithicus TaxID=329885 RepID=A0A4U0V9E9_9PEZI|nr:hypothetical protein LTS09_017156 [Friedmanniomyces endolithicus]KAK0317977.1 hypothetical protein LTR82_010967 [Friedmanniomyces endolithicus]KAK0895224.1 hypothetical protein LTR57_023125 [Friedmanniomyces endolithicus]KAK0966297.1 hypothetical protein LTS01_017907 [Friedmanniomyces endolithicus]KAK0967803.1 hypothetical protein LTR91_016978 [Friedmanniomyces endolithicus]
MTATRTSIKPWDFSHVLELVNSLATKDLTPSDEHHETAALDSLHGIKHTSHLDGIERHDFGTPLAKLGDFGKIWQYLGTAPDSPIPDVPPLTSGPLSAADLPVKIDYTSDGATYFKSTTKRSKGVSWQDQIGAEEAAADTATDRSASPDTPGSPATPALTKSQRKKQNRRDRKVKEAAEALKNATVSESEADHTHRKPPARKASVHVSKSDVTPAPERKAGLLVSASAAPVSLEASLRLATARVAEKTAELKRTAAVRSADAKVAPLRQLESSPAIKHHTSQHTPSTTTQRTGNIKDSSHVQPRFQWLASPSKASGTRLLPSSVQPSSQQAALPIASKPTTALTPPFAAINQNTSPSAAKPRFVIEPKIVRSGEDRHWALLMKLIGDFYEDRGHIISPMNLTTHNNNPKGIHVFVDASNIFIGFTDQLKRSRGIPQYAQIPQVDLSFDALALLMERRRPVAKRVLVGSTPHLPAFDKAKAVGYECSILEKVYKARELTDRQIYFRDRDRNGRQMDRHDAKASSASRHVGVAAGSSPQHTAGTNHHRRGSGSGSGSETGSAPQYAPARMIEQGVDEILHLKMLESIVDSETPSTIVLATGDAAQAEYSPGFMAMVERALKKGWKVELVSWSKNISGMYRKPEWLATWGSLFRVVFLDDYAEELLEM